MHLQRTGVLLALGLIAGAARAQTVDLIVQFREPEAAGKRTAMTASAMAARGDALETLLAALRRDLPRLASAKATADGEPLIRHTYHRVLFGAALRVPRALRDSIEALPYVASVHEDQIYRATSADSDTQIQAQKAWAQFGTRGAGVKVAVIDSGIDYRHPALGGGIGSGFKVVGGWDFVDNDADPMDKFGHGTHVAGIIAGNSPDVLGVAPEASLVAYRALADSTGSAADVIAAIERSVDPDQNNDPSDHVDVVNLSLGGPPDDNDPGAAAVEHATAAGIVFCIAAGNGGDYGNVSTPGISPSAITVGAVDRRDGIATFSSRGPSMFYAIKPEVVAPGVFIISSSLNGSTALLSGTSMAAPHVAGVAALVKAVHRDWSPADVKSAIVATAVPFDDDVMTKGSGRVDALAAASVETLVSPPIVSFGQIDPARTTWTATRSLTLRNRSSQTQTLTANVRGLRDGIVLTVTPPSLTLEPGAAQTVQIDLAVTNAAVPAPQEGSLSFGGRIEWSGAAVPVHVPWAFVKGAILALRLSDGQYDSIVDVLGTKKKRSVGRFHGAAQVLWPFDTVDLVAVDSPSGFIQPRPPERIVAMEQVDTAVTTRVTVPMRDARYAIASNAADEKGLPLVNSARDCREQVIFAFPSGRKYGREQSASNRALFGRLSDRVTLYTSVHCADSAARAVYTALLDATPGLSGSFAPTLRSPWARHDLQLPGNATQYLLTLYPSVRIPGPESTYFTSGGGGFGFLTAPPALTLYSAGRAGDADLVTILSREPFGVLCSDASEVMRTDICRTDTAFLYLRDEDARMDGDLYREISPMAYRVPAGAALDIAAGPYWGEIRLFVEPAAFFAIPAWSGPANEKRVFPDAAPDVSLRDASGNVVGLVSSQGYAVVPGELPGGAYRAEAGNSLYEVGGIPGRSTIVALFDSRRADPAPPQITGMRVVDGDGRLVTALAAGSTGSLVFSVADTKTFGLWMPHVAPLESATRVEYSRHGENQWQPLPAAIEASQYLDTQALHDGVGTMYRADLSSMVRNVSGPIDLRVHAEDAAGNAIEVTLAPALVVPALAPPTRRRAAR